MTSFPAFVRWFVWVAKRTTSNKKYDEREVFFLIEIKSFSEEQKSVNSKKESPWVKTTQGVYYK